LVPKELASKTVGQSRPPGGAKFFSEVQLNFLSREVNNQQALLEFNDSINPSYMILQQINRLLTLITMLFNQNMQMQDERLCKNLKKKHEVY